MSAAPLWGQLNSQPGLLRFASDDFIEELNRLLANEPDRLPAYLAQPETWRDPLPQPAAARVLPQSLRAIVRQRSMQQAVPTPPPTPDTRPLKLFQPAHQRFYLVSACLVCRTPGMPDRVIESDERAAFVIRRLLPQADRVVNGLSQTTSNSGQPAALGNTSSPWDCPPPGGGAPSRSIVSDGGSVVSSGILTPEGACDEYAFVVGSDGPTWQLVPPGSASIAGEEQLPMFPTSYLQADGHRRRLLAGFIPVGRREAYLGAPLAVANGLATQDGLSATSSPDPRLKAMLDRVFFIPYKQLAETNEILAQKLTDDRDREVPVEEKPNIIHDQQKLFEAARFQIQETSWYLMADLAQFIEEQFPNLLKAFGSTPPSLPDEYQPILTVLKSAKLQPETKTALHIQFPEYPPSHLASTLGAAIYQIWQFNQSGDLEKNDNNFASGLGLWPDFLFPLVDISYWNATDNRWDPGFYQLTPFGVLDQLYAALCAALPAQSTARLAPVPLASQVPAKIDDPGWFIVRCVYDRPNCLPAPETLLSEPTQPFQLASFFDPDAPARPIRIALPIDISPAGLRKFDKNTAFMVSDALCGQITRAKGMGLVDLVMSVMPWPLHKDLSAADPGPCGSGGTTFGMICSLSIPIITICALILLIIIVSLLDIIFHWIPFFISCFPLPGFKGKRSD